jgi:hypothetical protein
MATGPTRWGGIGLLVLSSAGIVAVVSIFNFGIGGWPGRAQAFRDLALGLLVTFLISGLASTITPLLIHRISHFNGILRWAVLVTALALCGAAGLSLGITLLSLLQVLPED